MSVCVTDYGSPFLESMDRNTPPERAPGTPLSKTTGNAADETAGTTDKTSPSRRLT